MDFLHEANILTFDIIMGILFGDDCRTMPIQFPYERADGTTVQVGFYELYMTVHHDATAAMLVPLNTAFPFLVRRGIGRENSRVCRNRIALRAAILHFIHHSSDENSVGFRMKKGYEGDEERLISDVALILFAGHDTSSHSLASMIYFLKRETEVEQRL